MPYADQWTTLLVEPPGVDAPRVARWFAAIAERLLGGSRLVVAGVAHRLTEVEFYYHGGTHLDPFAHRDPVQRHTGRWYFHRTGGTLRGGSFKGLDLTFAGADAFGGILIRGVEPEGGALIDGPSRTVDHLLHMTGQPRRRSRRGARRSSCLGGGADLPPLARRPAAGGAGGDGARRPVAAAVPRLRTGGAVPG
ncbi:MAG: hypothetical protein U0736_22415 [Gemmataceae bacterium]